MWANSDNNIIFDDRISTDFNIIGKDHVTFQALNENGFNVPDALKALPKGSNIEQDKAYDQIAVWGGTTKRPQPFKAYTRVEITRAGIFDYYKTIFRLGKTDEAAAQFAKAKALESVQGEVGRQAGIACAY